jgi:hypothetical protein
MTSRLAERLRLDISYRLLDSTHRTRPGHIARKGSKHPSRILEGELAALKRGFDGRLRG